MTLFLKNKYRKFVIIQISHAVLRALNNAFRKHFSDIVDQFFDNIRKYKNVILF